MPMLAQCSAFDPAGGEFADIGTDRHSALRAHLNGDDSELDLMDEEDQSGIRWAADYIRANTSSQWPVQFEVRGTFTAPNFEEISGTPDVVCGPDVFDFKWRPRDYSAQMACYAAMQFEKGIDRVHVHILFGATKRAERLEFTADAVEKIIAPILDRCVTPAPKSCDYCHWCSKQLTCSENTKPAEVVGAGYAEPGLLDITTWRPSDMMNLSDPENVKHLAFALTLWRKVLKKWGESVEFHAMEAATKMGLQLPGYELKTRQGKQFVADVESAFKASGLEPADFLKACTVRLNTSKKYPNQHGLDVIFKEKFQEASIAAAKRTVKSKIGDLIQRGNETLQLKAVKGDDDADEI